MRTKLKILRVKHGWSQKDFAERLGLTAAAYSFIETGKRFGSSKTWEKIKEIYNLKDKEMWDIQHENN